MRASSLILMTSVLGLACNGSLDTTDNLDRADGDLPGSDGGSSRIDGGATGGLVDGSSAQAKACSPENLVPIQLHKLTDSDALLALALSYANGPAVNLAELTVSGKVLGFLFVDPKREIGGFLVARPSSGKTSMEEEASVRVALGKHAGLTNPVVQPFTTWDGFAAATGTYDYGPAKGDDLKARLNKIASGFLGSGVTGLFKDGKDQAGHTEKWRLQLEVIRRSDTSTLVLGALTTMSKIVGAKADPLQSYLMRDVTNGSALGHSKNATMVQCDVSKSIQPKVDFLWVVDDSCSMAPHQTAVARAADAFIDRLRLSQVDYRVALIGTSYWQDNLQDGTPSKNYGALFGFTRDLQEFKSWLRQPCPLEDRTCLGAVQCTGVEKGVESAYDALLNPKNGATALLPPPAAEEPDDPKRVRRHARLVVIFVSDAGDQSNAEQKSSTTASDQNDGPWWDKSLGTWPAIYAQIAARSDLSGLMTAGILCADGVAGCGNETTNPSLYDVLVAQTRGVQGLIADDASVDATMQGIVNAAIGSTGVPLSKPPISASLKVVQGRPAAGCPQPTPQHPQNGFVYDGVANRISFFGACRPAVNTEIAISYKYWIEKGPLQ